jgi:hypothetical protein
LYKPSQLARPHLPGQRLGLAGVLTALTGILVHMLRLAGLALPTYLMYLVHLAVAVPMLVVEVLFGKRAHLAYRPLAL